MCMMQAKPDNPHRLAPDDPQAGGLQLRKKPGQLLTREQLKAQKVRPYHTRCSMPGIFITSTVCEAQANTYFPGCD